MPCSCHFILPPPNPSTKPLRFKNESIPTPKFKNPRAKYNFQGRTCSISGVGSYVPARILTNANWRTNGRHHR
jgi:hypothetical protein